MELFQYCICIDQLIDYHLWVYNIVILSNVDAKKLSWKYAQCKCSLYHYSSIELSLVSQLLLLTVNVHLCDPITKPVLYKCFYKIHKYIRNSLNIMVKGQNCSSYLPKILFQQFVLINNLFEQYFSVTIFFPQINSQSISKAYFVW